MLQSIAQRMSDMSGALESIREDLRKEREAEKEKERRRFWRKVEVQDSGGAGPVN
jgi:siroheme synthase (precorrin-2 oxidase/ferrochelatase)